MKKRAEVPRRVRTRPARVGGVVGAGIMGGGIAWALARAGITVRMKRHRLGPPLAGGMSAAAGMFRCASSSAAR